MTINNKDLLDKLSKVSKKSFTIWKKEGYLNKEDMFIEGYENVKTLSALFVIKYKDRFSGIERNSYTITIELSKKDNSDIIDGIYIAELSKWNICQFHIPIENIISVEEFKGKYTLEDSIPVEYRTLLKRSKEISIEDKINLQEYEFVKGQDLSMGANKRDTEFKRKMESDWFDFSMIGFEVPKGWRGIVTVILEEFEKLNKEFGVKVTLSQVKEKFGELRVYTWTKVPDNLEKGTKDELYSKVSFLTSWGTWASRKTCEVCWKDWYNQEKKMWYNTFCDEHWGEDKRYFEMIDDDKNIWPK